MNEYMKEPEISLFLQDYIDIVYVMQKHVFPNIDALNKYKVTFSDRARFYGIEREYNAIIDYITQKPDFLLHLRAGINIHSRNQQKAFFFARKAIWQMRYFYTPNPYSSYYPNCVDLSMLENLPEERIKKAKLILKKLFKINEHGILLYQPEMVFQNYFAVFRDCREVSYVNFPDQ